MKKVYLSLILVSLASSLVAYDLKIHIDKEVGGNVLVVLPEHGDYSTPSNAAIMKPGEKRTFKKAIGRYHGPVLIALETEIKNNRNKRINTYTVYATPPGFYAFPAGRKKTLKISKGAVGGFKIKESRGKWVKDGKYKPMVPKKVKMQQMETVGADTWK